MSTYNERIANHELNGKLTDLIATLDQPPDDVTEEEREGLLRSHRVAVLGQGLLGQADPELVPPGVLNDLAAQVDKIQAAVNGYLTERTPERLGAVSDATDPFVRLLVPHLLPFHMEEEFTSAREQARTYRASAGQYFRGIREEVEEVKTGLQSATARVETLKTDTDTVLQGLKDRVSEATTEVDQQKSRLDQALSTNQQQFSDAQDRRSTQFQELLAERQKAFQDEIESAKTTHADQTTALLEQLRSEAGKTLEELQSIQEQVEKVAGAIGASAQAGHHRQYADKEDKMANLLRGGALASLLAVAVLGILAFVQHGPEFNWTAHLDKLYLAIPLAAIASYLIAESHTHRRNAKAARDVELDLLSIGPFLAELDPEAAEMIRSVVALRLFAPESREPETGAGDESSKPLPPTSLGLAQMALKSIDDYRKSKPSSGS